MLAALSVVAYLFFARSTHEMLEPLLGLPEGQTVYSSTMRHVATTIALFDLPLVAIVAVAAYVLARVSIGPLVTAREREERFAADAAHELRTPLATIAAVAQAARGSDATGQTRALAKIAEVAFDASGLLGDLMLLMRDAPDETRLHEPVDMAALASGLVRDAQAVERDIEILLTTPAGGAYVIGEERALRQLTRNLLANAIHHARRNVNVEIGVDARWIELCVDDDGDGIAPADRERVFERFFKADPASPGSGLGLAICRHIAMRHGGTIAIEDRSRFVARFPNAAR